MLKTSSASSGRFTFLRSRSSFGSLRLVVVKDLFLPMERPTFFKLGSEGFLTCPSDATELGFWGLSRTLTGKRGGSLGSSRTGAAGAEAELFTGSAGAFFCGMGGSGFECVC